MAILFNAGCFAVKPAVDRREIEFVGDRGGNLGVMFVDLVFVPAVEFDVADGKRSGRLERKKRACVAAPEVFGREVSQVHGIRDQLANGGVLVGGGHQGDGFKCGNRIGDGPNGALGHRRERLSS